MYLHHCLITYIYIIHLNKCIDSVESLKVIFDSRIINSLSFHYCYHKIAEHLTKVSIANNHIVAQHSDY